MFNYAELNDNNVCVGIKMVGGPIESENHILIDSLDNDYLFQKYEDGTWSGVKFVPDHAQVELSRMEKVEARQDAIDSALIQLMMEGVSLQ